MSIQSKGTAREHQIKRKLEAEGWVVVRSPASGSPVDLWAIRPWIKGIEGSEVVAIQSKANTGSPWKSFGPKERRELRTLARGAGAVPILVHWPPHGQELWYLEDEWPKTKERA